jgi:hypothetical protein
MASQYKETLQELLKYDIGRNAYFDVKIFSGSSTDRTFTYLCHSAELPGESTATVNQKIYGIVEKFPIMTAYNDTTLSFYSRGSDVDITRLKFLGWITTATGRGEVLNSVPTTYNVKYKNDITGKIEITHYAVSGEPLTKCILFDAFPLAIAQTPLSWSSANQAVELNVTFAYTEYTYEFLRVDNNKPIIPQTINPANRYSLGVSQQTAIDTQKSNYGLSKFTVTSPNLGTTLIS